MSDIRFSSNKKDSGYFSLKCLFEPTYMENGEDAFYVSVVEDDNSEISGDNFILETMLVFDIAEYKDKEYKVIFSSYKDGYSYDDIINKNIKCKISLILEEI